MSSQIEKSEKNCPNNVDHITIIDENSKFETDMSKFDAFLAQSGIDKNSEKKFYVISIMGGQSGGKSTLLNYLFNTNFPVLPNGHRKAMSKGISVSISKNKNQKKSAVPFIFDLEGSDSSEKSESEGETFSRKSALFALAVSEILIVNIWTHDVGKRSAMNLTILRSIFEVNLKLSQSSDESSKTKILFALRDFDEMLFGPISEIEIIVTKELEKLWNSLEKPKKFHSLKMGKYFEFYFVGLPHKEYKSEEFFKKTFSLQKLFNEKNKNSLLSANNHLAKTKEVPIASMFEYLSGLWSSIKSVEELNIVSQKESLTNKLAEKFYEESLAFFAAEKARKIPKGKHINAFYIQAKSVYNRVIASFDTKVFPGGPESPEIADSKQYENNGISRIRIKWRNKLLSEIEKDYVEMQKKLYEQFTNALSSDHNKWLTLCLKETAFDAKRNFLKSFKEALRKKRLIMIKAWENGWKSLSLDFLLIERQNGTKFAEDFAQFSKKMFEIEMLFIEKFGRQFESFVTAEVEKRLTSIKQIFQEGEEGVWRKVFQHRMELHRFADSLFETFKDVWPEENFGTVLLEIRSSLHAKTVSAVESEIKRQRDYIEQILVKKFTKLFRYDELGVPRNWATSIKISPIWVKAKDDCLKMLQVYSEVKDFESRVYPSLTFTRKLLTKEQKSLISRNFEIIALSALKEAEMQQFSRKSNIPLWFYGIIFLLGFNEFVWLLKNPVVVVLALTALSVILYFWNDLPQMSLSGLKGQVFEKLKERVGFGFKEKPTRTGEAELRVERK